MAGQALRACPPASVKGYPTKTPFLAPIAAIAGTAASAVGGLGSSGAQSASANYQSQIASNNAVLAGMQRASAISAGHEQTGEKSLQGALEFGRAKAAMGANGVDVNTGSNVDVLAGNKMGASLPLRRRSRTPRRPPGATRTRRRRM